LREVRPPDSNYVASAELYDPVTGQWTPTGSLNVARAVWQTATLLAKWDGARGRGVHGPWDEDRNVRSLYDPVAGTWSNTGALSEARELHTATLLTCGKVLVAGGYGGQTLASAGDL